MNGSPYQKALLSTARPDRYFIVIMVFLQCVHLTEEFVKMKSIGHDQLMLENVYKGVLYPFPDALVCFAFEADVHNILRTRKVTFACFFNLHFFAFQRLIG